MTVGSPRRSPQHGITSQLRTPEAVVTHVTQQRNANPPNTSISRARQPPTPQATDIRICTMRRCPTQHENCAFNARQHPTHYCSTNALASGLSPLIISPTTTSAPAASPAVWHQSGRPKAQQPPSSGRRVLFQELPSSLPGRGVTSSFILLAGAAPLLMTLTSNWVQGVGPSLQLFVSFT